jgi:hypothetical protein
MPGASWACVLASVAAANFASLKSNCLTHPVARLAYWRSLIGSGRNRFLSSGDQ